MKPDKLTIHDLFQKQRCYTVPLYQRSYVWGQSEQWEPLWEDIERQAEACFVSPNIPSRHSHFLGAVVLNRQRIVGSSVARSEVIDGQQRLTTLQLFLAALGDFAAAAKSTYAARLRRLTINEDEPDGSDGSFKVWPTNSDRVLFRKTMTAGSVAALVQSLDLDDGAELPRLGAAYRYFAGKIDEYVKRGGPESAGVEKRIFSLLQGIPTGATAFPKFERMRCSTAKSAL
jgi:hypothetical protein